MSEIKQVNIKLGEDLLAEIDAAVNRRNRDQDAGRPSWTRTSFMVAAAIVKARSDNAAPKAGA